MPTYGWTPCNIPVTREEKMADRRRPVNQGKGRGVTKPPVRRRRRR